MPLDRSMPYEIWAVTVSIDTELGFLILLELYGTDIAWRRMLACRVMEALNVIENV